MAVESNSRGKGYRRVVRFEAALRRGWKEEGLLDLPAGEEIEVEGKLPPPLPVRLHSYFESRLGEDWVMKLGFLVFLLVLLVVAVLIF